MKYRNDELIKLSFMDTLAMLEKEEISLFRLHYFKRYLDCKMEDLSTEGHEGCLDERQPRKDQLEFLLRGFNEASETDKKIVINPEMISSILCTIEDGIKDYGEPLYEEWEELLNEQYDRVDRSGDGVLKVYLIKNSLGHLKIGITSGDVEKRRMTLQTGSSCKLNVVASFYCDSHPSAEKELHREFSDYRLEGEWFDGIIEDSVILKCQEMNLKRC